MMPSVYIETTIPSYYYETRKDPSVVAWRQVTRRWWDSYRVLYDLYTSQFVLAELVRTPSPKSKRTLALIEEASVLGVPKGIEEVVEYYVEHRLMPTEEGGDAFHLAMASMHNMDFLLTWNCRHLANANKVQHLTVLNRRLGLYVPVITTPLTLIPEDEI